MNLSEMLQERAKLVVRKEEADQKLEDLKKELGTMDEAVFLKMDNEGTSSVKIPGLGSFSSREVEYFSLAKDKKEETMIAIKGYAPELVTETVNGQRLSAFMREAKKNSEDLPKEITSGVSSYVKRSLTWRRTA